MIVIGYFGIILLTVNKNRTKINNILLGIIPFILILGYFERYITLLPQYFVSTNAFASNDEIQIKEISLTQVEKVSVSLIDTISSITVPDWKVKRVFNYLNIINAPLAKKAKFLVQAAAYYKIDYNLVAAISVIESTGGKFTYRPYNAWGWGGSSRAFTFRNWEEAIVTVTRGLAGYYDAGLNTPAKIAPRYNPVTPNEWSRKVSSVMSKM